MLLDTCHIVHNMSESRRTENDRKETPQEECPKLILAPFSRPPQVVFDNVLIGTSCERNLEVFNPLKCVLQAILILGHLVRARSAMRNPRAVALRRRWRAAALQSTRLELYDQAMEVLNSFADMNSAITAFRSLEILTEMYPMTYSEAAPKVVRSVYRIMSAMNRSIACVEVLKASAAVLANLTRYSVTGPKIYAREHIPPLLKYMWRFSTNEDQLFLILATYLWLYSRYDGVREDLTDYLHTPENHKMMESIKRNVERAKRMASNASKHKLNTPAKFNPSASFSQNSLLPALEPDYGMASVDQPRYFVDAQQAMHCLFLTYKL